MRAFVKKGLRGALEPAGNLTSVAADFFGVHEYGRLSRDGLPSFYHSQHPLARTARTRVLCIGRLRRKWRRRGDRRPIHFLDRAGDQQRSAELAKRIVIGNWEGDLITGRDNKAAIGTQLSTRPIHGSVASYLQAMHPVSSSSYTRIPLCQTRIGRVMEATSLETSPRTTSRSASLFTTRRPLLGNLQASAAREVTEVNTS